MRGHDADEAVRHPAHDAELPACGEMFRVRRTLALTRHMEQIAGALWPLSMRLKRAEITQADLTLLYEAALRGEDGAPKRSDLALWIHEQGTHKPALMLAGLVASLVMGNDALRALHGADVPAEGSAADVGEDGDGARPPSAARHRLATERPAASRPAIGPTGS